MAHSSDTNVFCPQKRDFPVIADSINLAFIGNAYQLTAVPKQASG